ncbi:L-type lectin-domain containing receptor kinase IX.1 [Acorus gramineus]|uniref:L-type lectin-domain containing receptor kinase IX.1 n=1 Tax=Acorus gramineus TaxID=55184 RepID=A0AAV9AVZ6_ACOGR|nr:L-type lectin-domain containing receptor kinase IX.1 [Acorus gramineus]
MRTGRRIKKDVDLLLERWPQKFPYIKLVTATNNFMEAQKVGEGGFGVVYKGFLIDLSMVVAIKAIKRFSDLPSDGKTQYETEVKVTSRLRHRNVIRLIGYSHHKDRPLLVYEFAPRGTLSSHLFDSKKPPLSLAQRQKIALGLARALRYLHEECAARYVVHRDVKSANVLLDENFEVKLTDFGLAMVGDHGGDLQETDVWGTVGYVAPEYQSTGKFSKGSDVYSFGVVVLEIACGRMTMDLVRWVWGLYGAGRILEAADARLAGEFDRRVMERLMVLGLWCANPDHTERPSMGQAVGVLEFLEVALPKLALEMPSPRYVVPRPSATAAEATSHQILSLTGALPGKSSSQSNSKTLSFDSKGYTQKVVSSTMIKSMGGEGARSTKTYVYSGEIKTNTKTFNVTKSYVP